MAELEREGGSGASLPAHTKCLALGDYLDSLAQGIENKRSAEHSRLNILAAAARLADRVDVHNYRVPDVCALCGISRATFYLHFSAREDLFIELMQHLTTLECGLTPDLAACPDVGTAVELLVDWYMDVHLANASLFANLTYLQRTNAAVAASWKERARRLHETLCAELGRFAQFEALDRAEADFVLEFLGRAINTLTGQFHDRSLLHSPYLPADLATAKLAVTKAFFRALFGYDRAPMPDGVRTPGRA